MAGLINDGTVRAETPAKSESSSRYTIFIPGISRGGVIYNDTYLACSVNAPSFPVTVAINPSAANPTAWKKAIAEWNTYFPGTFREVAYGQPSVVKVEPSTRTWVSMPCNGKASVVYAAGDVNLDYWAAHELGHALGFRDWITSTTSTTGYINPGRCPGGYDGIMSYCTPRTRWWSVNDTSMMRAVFNR